MNRVAGLSLVLMTVVITGIAVGDDSPQFRGPKRDGVFPEKGLMKAWPENGPPLVWVSKGLGRGNSTVSVVKGRIYTTGMLDDQKGYVLVLDLDGKIAHKFPYGPETLEKQAPGPRSTPTLDGDRLYLLSGLGVLYCVEPATGKTLWQVEILKKFGAENSEWNVAESILVDGNRVYCTPGGPEAAMAALDKNTGETIWTTKGLDDKTSYCTPILAAHNNRRVLLDATGKYIIGVDAENGTLLWKHPHKAPYDIHAVSPVYKDGLVYFTAGEGSGGGLLEMSPDATSVQLRWTDKNLDCLHHGVVLLDGYLYGCGQKQLVCLEMKTGKLMWSTKEISQGAVVAADGMLYIYEGPKSGVVSLVKATPTGFERTGKFAVTEGTDNHWPHPTIANGRMYIRHGDALLAYDIAEKK